MSQSVVTCPQCDLEGYHSTLSAKSIPLIPEYVQGYYDDLGGYHVHNPDTTQVGLQCSRGHVFTYALANKCWCGWMSQK